MKSLKTVLLSTAVLAGFGLFLGGKDAFADEQYTVQSGDTLSTIATNFYGYSSDDTINAIVEANEIADKNLILLGSIDHPYRWHCHLYRICKHDCCSKCTTTK